MKTHILQSPIGPLSVTTMNNQLTQIHFLPTDIPAAVPHDACSELVQKELDHYFKSPQHCFRVALSYQGTVFQKAVWEILRSIPLGKTMTYGEIAKKLNSHPRAVGNACRANPIAIIIPCHRVVGKENLGGFSGKKQGPLLEIKKRLLQHEGVIA